MWTALTAGLAVSQLVTCMPADAQLASQRASAANKQWALQCGFVWPLWNMTGALPAALWLQLQNAKAPPVVVGCFHLLF